MIFSYLLLVSVQLERIKVCGQVLNLVTRFANVP